MVLKNNVRLEEIAQFINGYAFKPSDWHSKGKKIIRIQNLTDQSKPYNLTTLEIPERLKVTKGDILVSWSATLDVFEWDKEDEAWLNQHIFKVLLNENKILKPYFKYVLKNTIESMLKYTHGSTMKHIVRSDFLNTKIYLPNKEDQKRIVAILDKADALRQKRKQALALLDELLRSTFLEMFGDPIKNFYNYKIQKLENVCEKITDGTHDTPKRIDKGIKFITGKHIRPYKIDYENSDFVSAGDHNLIYKRCNPVFGDILYTNIGVNIGTAAMNSVEYEFSMKNVALIKHKRNILSSRYLEHFLNNELMKKEIIRITSLGGAQQFLSLNDIKKLRILIPPIEFQNQFAKIVEQTEAAKAKMQQSLQELDNQFLALMQRAFKGEL